MTKNPNRISGGKTAKQRGSDAEIEFDLASNYYRNQYLLDWQSTYAEFVTLGRIKGQIYGYYKEKATADRILSIAEWHGRTAWVEIKSFSGKNKKTLDKGLHQYDQMILSMTTGRALGFYIIRWRWDDGRQIEWRLYPVQMLDRGHSSIVFTRQAGLHIPFSDGWPDYLPVILEAKE